MKRSNIKYFVLVSVGIVLSLLFINYPAPFERILNIQNYLITVGGIISAFVITYLSAKIFNIKAERENRQTKIDELGQRLTAFRQIVYFVIRSFDFWIKYDDINKFKREYRELDFYKLSSHIENVALVRSFYEDTTISHNTITLYSAMEAIYNSGDGNFALTKDVNYRYSLQELSNYRDACNQVWYFLEGKFEKHGSGLFDDTKLAPHYEENWRELIPKADLRQKGKDLNRTILGNLGGENYDYLIPKMIELIKKNTGVPKGLLKTLYSLLSIMNFGVICPIVLQSIKVEKWVDITCTLTLVALTTLSLINFLFEFYDLLYDEIHTNRID